MVILIRRKKGSAHLQTIYFLLMAIINSTWFQKCLFSYQWLTCWFNAFDWEPQRTIRFGAFLIFNIAIYWQNYYYFLSTDIWRLYSIFLGQETVFFWVTLAPAKWSTHTIPAALFKRVISNPINRKSDATVDRSKFEIKSCAYWKPTFHLCKLGKLNFHSFAVPWLIWSSCTCLKAFERRRKSSLES